MKPKGNRKKAEKLEEDMDVKGGPSAAGGRAGSFVKRTCLGLAQLPEEAQGAVLCKLRDARDVAISATVCTLWRRLSAQVDTLDFVPLALKLTADRYDETVSTMILRSRGLRRLRIRHEVWGGPAREALLLSWLLHAGRQLDELYLEDSDDLEGFRNTRQLLNISQYCKQLQKLTFSGEYIFKHEPTMAKMCYLRTLVLEKVALSQDNLSEILESCLVLEDLSMRHISALTTAKIRVSHIHLKRVEVFMGDMQDVSVGGPAVTEIRAESAQPLNLAFHMCATLECLFVKCGNLRVVEPCSSALRNLKHLTLDCPQGCQFFQRLLQRCWTKFSKGFSSLEDLRLGGGPTGQVGLVGDHRAPAMGSVCPALKRLQVLTEEAVSLVAADWWRFFGSESVPLRFLEEVVIAATKLNAGLASFLSRLCASCPNLRSLKVVYTGETGEYYGSFFNTLGQLGREYPKVSLELTGGKL